MITGFKNNLKRNKSCKQILMGAASILLQYATMEQDPSFPSCFALFISLFISSCFKGTHLT